MRYINCLLLVVIFSCKPESASWKEQWTKDNLKLKEVVSLLKQGRLQRISGRGIHQIPDSIDLKEPYGQLVYRQTDFTYDSSYSIVFYPDELHKDKTQFVFVFTDNTKRLNEYDNERRSVVKIEDNWYCLGNSYLLENMIKNRD